MKKYFKVLSITTFIFLAFIFNSQTVSADDACDDAITNGTSAGPCYSQEYQNDCSPSYVEVPQSVFGQPGYCSYSRFRVHNYTTTVNSGSATKSETSVGACITDPGSINCHTYPNYTIQGCSVDADCATSDACNVGTCSGLYNYNYVCNHDIYGNPITCFTSVKTCKVTNIAGCQVPVGDYCGDGICNNGETNATCPGDCQPATCPFGTEPTISIDNTSFQFRGAQGENIPVTYKVIGNAYATWASQSFTCPVNALCNGSASSPQSFSNAIDPVWIYTYTVRTGTLGSQVIRQNAQAGSNDPFGRCSNANFTGAANIYVYRGDAYNVSVSSSVLCGANQVTWSKYNIDDLFNIQRTNMTTNVTQIIATNVPGNSYTDNTVVIGTKYRYYVQIANRNGGEPAGNWVWAAENFGPTNGVAPVACPVIGSCGTANKTYPSAASSYGSDTYCNTGTPSSSPAFPAAGSSASWTCNGSGGGANSGTCTAVHTAAVVNGACGASNGGTFTSQPASGLCNAGTPSPVSGSGPWTWQCTGSGPGGTTASCSAQIAPRILTNPANFSFTAQAGNVAPTQNATVRNNVSSAATLDWNASVTSGGAWLSISRSSGNEPANWTSNPPIVVTASAVSLAAGTYNGNIRITSNDTLNPTINIPVTFTVTAAPACPAGTVNLASASILVGNTTTASAPAGFSGGSFGSSNSGVASVSGTTITGVSVGSANITGTGWSYTNGATNCSLSAAAVTVGPAIPNPPGGGGGGAGCNSSTCSPALPAGGTLPACSIVRVYWTDNSTNETGFRIYRDSSLVGSTSTISSAGTGALLFFNDTPGDTNSHVYSVEAYNVSGPSARTVVTGVGGIGAIACVGNLGTSDKDIVAINGTNIGTGLGNQCGGTDPIGASVTLKEGDILKFSINLCNTGSAAVTSPTVTDTLINLAQPSIAQGGWNAMYDDGTGEAPIASFSINLAYDSANKRITFTGLPNIPIGATRRITFNALLTKPSGFQGQSARFQNSFSATAPGVSFSGATPLLPFYTGTGVPIIIEVP